MRHVERLVLAACVLLGPLAGGQIATDGKLGARVSYGTSGDVTIDPALGRRVGTNLFHSFRQFNVATNQTVTLDAASPVQRVLVRVTGGERSHVDGVLRCPVDLFVMNPAGITFGGGASLDVAGSVVATTADSIRLADGRTFEARGAAGADAVLSSAPPQAYGFLAARPMPVDVTGNFSAPPTLAVAGGKTLAIVAGGVRIESARLQAIGGSVALVGVGGPGRVALDVSSSPAPAAPELPRRMARGPVELVTSAEIDVDLAGRALIRASDLRMSGSSAVHSVTDDPAGGGLIDVGLTGLMDLRTNATVRTKTLGDGRAGDVRVAAAAVSLAGRAIVGSDSGDLSTRAVNGGAGSVSIATDDLTVTAASTVQSVVYGAGGGGPIDVRARGRMVIDGDASAGTGVRSETILGSSGDAGAVTIRAGEVTLLNTAQVTSTTRGAGRAGDITIGAGTMTIDGAGRATAPTLVQSRSGTAASNDGGNIVVNVDGDLTIAGGGVISASTFGRGAGGSVDVHAGAIEITGAPAATFTGIFSASRRLEDRTSNPPEVSPRVGLGDAGTVRVTADDHVTIREGGEVSVFAQRSSGGRLDVDAGRRLEMERGVISAQAQVRSGAITVAASDTIRLRDARITAQTPGVGGSITIDPRSVILDAGSVINGKAGARLDDVPVRIDADALLVSADSAILTSKQLFRADNDVAQRAVRLDESLLDLSIRLSDLCTVRFQKVTPSSFVVTGRGARPVEPGGLTPSD